MILQGDAIERMAEMEADSIDAIVCDPPYGLEFMGKEWDRLGATVGPFAESLDENGKVDYHGKGNAPFGGGGQRIRYGSTVKAMQEWHHAWATQALRILKPGGHLLAFGGTRTSHRLACAVEDAGFEIRDSLIWLYGSGFPKSLDVSKAIDKAAGAEGERGAVKSDRHASMIRNGRVGAGAGEAWDFPWRNDADRVDSFAREYLPATPEAAQWQGWGTALKPAHEPIVVARKPLGGTVAQTVLEHGTGALNVDGCRVGTEDMSGQWDREWSDNTGPMGERYPQTGRERGKEVPPGRWPPNVILSPEAGEELDRQSGETKSTGGSGAASGLIDGETYGDFSGDNKGQNAGGLGDTGGASRFFYCAKSSRAERNAGLSGFEEGPPQRWNKGGEWTDDTSPSKNHHPTVKPIALMRWLVRLVTPPGGACLDPFCGSGTTGAAAALEGFNFIGIEREAEYAAIAEARVAFWAQFPGADVDAVLASDARAREIEDAGQLRMM